MCKNLLVRINKLWCTYFGVHSLINPIKPNIKTQPKMLTCKTGKDRVPLLIKGIHKLLRYFLIFRLLNSKYYY